MTIDDDTPDIALIHAYAKGDDKAFETLYHRYRRQLYGFLRNLTGNPSVADEIFEETWVKVIDKLPSYRDDGKFSAWLFRVGRNLFIDHIRREKHFAGFEAFADFLQRGNDRIFDDRHCGRSRREQIGGG